MIPTPAIREHRRSMSRTPGRYDAEQVRRFSGTTIAYYDRFGSGLLARHARPRCQVAMGEQLGPGRIADVEHGEPAVMPGGIGEVAGDESVVQRVAPTLWPTRRLAATRPHAGDPPLADNLRPGRLRHVDDCQHLVGASRSNEIRGHRLRHLAFHSLHDRGPNPRLPSYPENCFALSQRRPYRRFLLGADRRPSDLLSPFRGLLYPGSGIIASALRISGSSSMTSTTGSALSPGATIRDPVAHFRRGELQADKRAGSAGARGGGVDSESAPTKASGSTDAMVTSPVNT